MSHASEKSISYQNELRCAALKLLSTCQSVQLPTRQGVWTISYPGIPQLFLGSVCQSVRSITYPGFPQLFLGSVEFFQI